MTAPPRCVRISKGDPALGRKHAVYDEMRAKGMTDYVAWPLYHTLGKRHVVTFATDRPGGFDDAHIAGLFKLLARSGAGQRNPCQEPAGANAAGNPMWARMPASSFWPAPPGGGSGTTVRAAIMICDLRDFTPDLRQLAAR